MILHGYWRSSAAWRVRIALSLKGLDADAAPLNFRNHEQRSDRYLSLNPQGLVPTLEFDGERLTQSLAIIEFIDETRPEPPLLPSDALQRARVRAMAQVIACDIHPINNLRVLETLRHEFGCSEDAVAAWCRRWIDTGFAALEAMVLSGDGRHCVGTTVTLADVCLVPQVYNARRFGTNMAAYPGIDSIAAHLMSLSAFASTAPENQPDAV